LLRYSIFHVRSTIIVLLYNNILLSKIKSIRVLYTYTICVNCRYNDVSENVVGERNRTSLGNQPFRSFSVYTVAAAQNTEVGSGQDNQRDFVGSQMYVNCIICIIINFDNTNFPYRRLVLTQLPVTRRGILYR